MSSERVTKLLLWSVAILWGLNVVMVKYLVGQFPPITLAAVRIGSAALLLGIAMIAKYGIPKLSGRAWLLIAGSGVSGVFLHQMTLAIGLQSTQASTGSMILGLNPLVTGVLAYWMFREPLTWKRLVGIFLGFAGVFIVVMGDSLSIAASSGARLGELYVVVAMIMYVISGLCIKKAAQTVPVLVLTAYAHLIAMVLLSITAIFEVKSLGGISWPTDFNFWFVLLFSGWVSTALGTIWWNGGISKIGAGRTAMFMNAMPVASLFFSVIFLNEHFTWIHILGFIVVLAAIFLGSAKVASAKPTRNITTPLFRGN